MPTMPRRTHASKTVRRFAGLMSVTLVMAVGQVASAPAATLALYDFSSGTDVASRLAATTVGSGVTASSFSETGTGDANAGFLTQAGDAGSTGGVYQLGPWDATTRLYFSITFANPTNLTSFSFCNRSAGAGAGGGAQLGVCGGTSTNNATPFSAYNLFLASGSATTTGGTALFATDQAPGGGTPVLPSLDLSSDATFQNLLGTYTFYFAAAAGATFDAARTWRIDNILLEGTPVPLPASLPLLLAALGGIGVIGRRRYRK
ncbi:MAG: hypothetical protein HONDAALG_00635 [Gammaproteobacteria bacterium]|nr:hypothetical protein [Gammaproteobacteria bacterium]